MKLKAPSLSPGKRAALERTLNWLVNLVTDLETRKAHLDELNTTLREAELRKAESEKNAALNPDAALALAGAESQLSRLSPQVKQLRESLERQTEVALLQANTVRRNDVRELIYGPAIEQLQTNIAAAISPFFAPDWARQHARQIMQVNCEPYRQIMFYLDRQSVVTTEFDTAKREINTLVSEIEKILVGGPLFEV